MKIILAAVACAAIAAPASAAIFTDDFESYALGLNQTNFAPNWTVTNGTVDLVGGPGFFDELCDTGKCVDLDGSTSDAGVFTSLSLNLIGGQTYTASYDLAASRRGGPANVLTVNFGTNSFVYGLVSGGSPATDPFKTFSLNFTPGSTGTYQLSFSTSGNDNVGPLLDNVNVATAAVPEPATWAMMITGFGGVGALVRRRRTAPA